MRVIIYLFTTFLIVNTSVFSQVRTVDFEKINTQDGLPHSTINDILQDSTGTIWIATDDGVAQYNNYEIKKFRYTPEELGSIRSNEVLKLHLDNQGRMWLGTKVSLELFDSDKQCFIHFNFPNPPERENVNVMEIYQANDSLLLIGTDGGGIRCFNTISYAQKRLFSAANDSIVGSRISSIYCQNDSLWLGTLDNGFFLFNINLSTLETQFIKAFEPETQVRKIAADAYNNILIATYGNGLLGLDKSSNNITNYLTPLLHTKGPSQIFDIISNQTYLYFSTDGDGLYRYNYNTKKVKQFINYGANTKSISNNVIRCIYNDKEDNLWLGHYNGGVSIAKDNKRFFNVKHNPLNKNSLSHSLVTSILPIGTSQVWVGTDGGGLNIIADELIYNSSNNNIQQLIKGDLPTKILSLFRDKDGMVWFGSYLEGVFLYNPKNKRIKPFTALYPKLTISNTDIRCFMQDRTGNIWLGTNGGGVNIINKQNRSIELLQHNVTAPKESLSLDWVRVMYEDELGFVWIGTTHGLNVYDPVHQSFRQYFNADEDETTIASNVIYSICEDAQKQLWIGTSAGLNKYNRTKDSFSRYTTKDGLSSNIINGIIPTDTLLWLTTNNGISKFSLLDETFINYTAADGLGANSFLNGSFVRNLEGNIYVGSVSGLSYFNPDSIGEIDTSIATKLTDFKLLNSSLQIGEEYSDRVVLEKSISNTDTITLLKTENIFTINYCALSYAYKNKVKYEYRLLGFTDEWLSNANNNSITYTNLASGIYTFQVRVSNIGVNNPVRSLTIIVLPRFYETWWFKTIILILVLIIGVIFYQLRVRILKGQRDSIKQRYVHKVEESAKEFYRLNSEIEDSKQRFHKEEMGYKSAQLISTTLLLTHKNERMNHVKNKIVAFCKEADNPVLKENFKTLIETIDEDFKVEEDWSRFEEHFNNVHKDFIQRLKTLYPELSHSYLRLCAYLKLDLSTKEIARLMNISQRGVEKSRSRLRKKFNLDQEVNLNVFITEI